MGQTDLRLTVGKDCLLLLKWLSESEFADYDALRGVPRILDILQVVHDPVGSFMLFILSVDITISWAQHTSHGDKGFAAYPISQPPLSSA